MAFEEQGRKSIHGHFTLWIKGYNELRKSLFRGQRKEKKQADALVEKYCDRITTTSLFEGSTKVLRQAWDHKCTAPIRGRTLPEVVELQDLRNLRHKHGYDEAKGEFAKCLHCDHKWTYEMMVEQYIRKVHKVEDLQTPVVEESDRKKLTTRLRAQIVELQRTPGITGTMSD